MSSCVWGGDISVALCSSSSSHTWVRWAPSQQTGRQSQAQTRGVCSGISPLKSLYREPSLLLPSLTDRRQQGKIIFTYAKSELPFARERRYLSSQAINSNYIFCRSSAATYFLCRQEPALLFTISHHVTEEPAIPPSACPASASPAWIWQWVRTRSCSQHHLAPLILAYWGPVGKVPTARTCSHLKKKK